MSAKVPVRLEKPFPDGLAHFYDDSWWGFLPAEVRSSALAWRARKALAETFDDDFLRQLTFLSHPIGRESLMRYGRWKILRLGLGLSAFGATVETRSRLIAPDLYSACATELDVGLLLAVSCAEVQHEPSFPLSGPDFHARPVSTKLGWEVKQPQQSERFKTKEMAGLQLSWTLNAFAGGLAIASKISGWSIELMVNEERLAEAAASAASHADLELALKGAVSRWATKPRPGKRPAADGVGIAAHRSSAHGIQVNGPSFAGDAEYEADRLQRFHLAKAAAQLESGGAPGFVVLAREQSGLVGNHINAMTRAIREEPATFDSVLGLVIYDTEVTSRHVLRAKAHVCLRSEARTLIPEISILQRGGKVSLSHF